MNGCQRLLVKLRGSTDFGCCVWVCGAAVVRGGAANAGPDNAMKDMTNEINTVGIEIFIALLASPKAQR